MNEPLFENKFVRDLNTAKEVYLHHFFGTRFMIIANAIAGLYGVAILAGLITDFQNARGYIPQVILLFIYIAVMVYAYNASVNTQVARDKEIADGSDFICSLTVTDSEITITNPVGTQSVRLDGLRYAFLTKSYIALVTDAKYMYLFKKDSFSKGSADEFVAFLKNKGLKFKK